ncbi:tyrosine-type recombinase/integrase [Pseudomonas sp. BP8]|uniref:tyrosine-type recombinase/integrase n=1 Tax=Pseudomonas sp. BP8 TaxID=2817864 RepID=UPI001AE997BB|nr:tyrosine-type recombinase/integrase [Pseudomonas sp. BP8]MBP2263520.1 integrase [Pseudomonas sp. BP8]HDS1735186.1 tyrosine-type recombinase/integrase [Pseudomonas putida]
MSNNTDQFDLQHTKDVHQAAAANKAQAAPDRPESSKASRNVEAKKQEKKQNQKSNNHQRKLDNDDNPIDEPEEDSELSEEERLFQEVEEDSAESQLEEVEGLSEVLDAAVIEPSITLVKKLEVANGSFPVSEHSNYDHAIWRLPHGKHALPNNIRFDRELPGSNALKRALIYHVIPEFSPFSYMRSYTTTKSWSNDYNKLEQYLFEPNKITASPEHIQLVSTPMVLKAFETAKNTGSRHHYFALFSTVRLWINLSQHKLIPEELRLDIQLEEIDTTERRKEVIQSRFQGTMDGWVSYSEEELELLMDHAMFWLEGVLPKLKSLKDYLVDTKAAYLSDRVLTRSTRQTSLEELMTITVDEKNVMTPQIRDHIKEGIQQYSYTWFDGYTRVLDGICSGIFILTALITGARKSELAIMHFDDLTQDAKGDYWMRIVRFKTAKNPKHGEEDHLPIPKFLGDMIRQYEDVRSIEPFKKQGWLFQAQRSVRVVKNATPNLVGFVIAHLKKALPIERLHCHRFRKTIAEILINRDERNIDIIRALFGHHSYAMTLRYIARNPLMVRTVAIAIEQSYTREFHEIVAGIRLGAHSGDAAKRIYSQIFKRPDEFAGKQFKLSLLSYISHILASGEPLFVRRTAVGTYCLTGEHFTSETLPPCLHGRKIEGDLIMPDPSNCQLDCKKIIVLETAKQALVDNETFYNQVLQAGNGKLAHHVEYELQRRIASIQVHLANLKATGHSSSQKIGVTHV